MRVTTFNAFAARIMRLCLLLSLALTGTALPFAAVAQQTQTAPEQTTDRLIVRFRESSATHAQIRASADRRVSRDELRRFAGQAGVDLAPLRAMSGEGQVL